MPRPSVTISLLRNDLRIHDNPAFYLSAQSSSSTLTSLSGFEQRHLINWHKSTHFLPIYIADPRFIDPSMFQFGKQSEDGCQTYIGDYPKCGKFRSAFLAQSVHCLADSIRSFGNELYVMVGKPEEILSDLVKFLENDYDVKTISMQRESCTEEIAVEKAVKAIAGEKGCFYWWRSLYPIETLPVDWNRFPETFSAFRKRVETSPVNVPAPLDAPSSLKPKVNLDAFFQRFPKYKIEAIHRFNDLKLVQNGGEKAALAHWCAYLRDNHLGHYKSTRNALHGANTSSRLSAYLNAGCLSVRQVYFDVEKYTSQAHVPKEHKSDAEWLLFELIWRDFFLFWSLKHGSSIFKLDGVPFSSTFQPPKKPNWKVDHLSLERWTKGETGIPFVDAAMRELNATGFMSNRGRQNVASFLTQSLNIDWRYGAAYFESLLIDHDPALNYGNWTYVAGVGCDPRARKFNMIKQARDYDPQGSFVKQWCPELAKLPDGAEGLFMPWVIPGYQKLLNWPAPVIIEPEWKRHGERQDKNPRGSDWKVKKYRK